MKLFSTGLEQANLVMTSNILELLWKKISECSNAHQQLSSSLRWVTDEQKEFTVVAFVACSTENQLLEGADLVSSLSSTAKESFALFKFLGKKGGFAINRAAITLFHQNLQQLSQLKDKINLSKPIIVTGHALGGSIASLFTLWLLEIVDFSKTKHPICITFGSPLIGDSHLQKALFQYSSWNSCFLHVVSNNDPIPRKFINHNANAYKPFGTFLLCSNLGCSCFEEPESILELLAATASDGSPNQGVDYENIVKHLKHKALFKNVSEADWATSPYTVGIVTQLSVIEYKNDNENITAVVDRMEKQEKKYLIGKRTVKPDKKLNEAKINMAKLEWYKKTSKDKNIGYYDTYKSKMFMSDINVEEIVKRLLNHWTDVVEEADQKPQEEGASLRTRWLYAGITYKKMVEPLCIADFYNDRKDCLDCEVYKRLPHFIRLEQLYKESEKTKGSTLDERKRNISHNLTEDSCFWARVEEAIILCELLKEKKTSAEELKKFEEYVMGLVKEYKVSPEIFLKRSSFMKRWWEKYKEAMGRSYSSPLTEFITNRKDKDYEEGKF